MNYIGHKWCLLLLMLTCVCIGCTSDNETDSEQEYSVCLLSYDDYSEAKLQNLQRDIQNCFDTLIPEITVKIDVMGNKPISATQTNTPNSKSRQGYVPTAKVS